MDSVRTGFSSPLTQNAHVLKQPRVVSSCTNGLLQKSRRMGSQEDSLQGLRFLCSLPNMETHADLIAGLPLYRLSEIFEDVRTLAGYNAGEIQLESLKHFIRGERRISDA